jgi:Tol biopolymer transport system component
MTPERWALISRIYHDALTRPAEARDGFIREACAGRSDLERDVRSLLSQPSSDSFLNQAAEGMTDDPTRLVRDSRLGRFMVRGLLGVGGMGEVYRAHDSSLGRDVAVKILPAAFVGNADRLARFEREARVLAALSHPHIAAIYGVEEIASAEDPSAPVARALVLELVEGENLAERLRRNRLPLGEALEIARQIADALEAAHERGVVHRDLKPANVKVRPDGVVKVLDFGLAKAAALEGDEPRTTAQRQPGETAAGMILGTPAYMSPEQARGLVVDKRTDIWAFGCVVYEMLAGHAPFAGETASDIMVAVLEREPDWSALPPATPWPVRRLLRRCLEKNPKRRWRDLGDAQLELDDRADAQPAAVPSPSARLWPWLVAAAALVGGLLLGRAWRGPDTPAAPMQFVVEAPEGHALASLPTPSPDGRQFVFVARSASGESAVWVRALDALSARRLAGTENALNPFWSHDGTTIGFDAGGALRRIPVAGGPSQRIATLDPQAMGASWSGQNTIVFTPSNRAPLYHIAAGGGEPRQLTTLNAERQENSHRWPQFLPDGRHFLFTSRSDAAQTTGVYVASLDDPHSTRRLLDVSSAARYVSSGHLLFVRDNTLFAQRFDASSLTLSGDPVALAGDLASEGASASSAFAASQDGSVLTYFKTGQHRLVWFDRSGNEVGTVATRGTITQFSLSPDATRIVAVMPDPQNGNRDVWIFALATGIITRLTAHPASDWFPVWSPDGREVLFTSDRNSMMAIYRTAAAGGSAEQLVYRSDSPQLVGATDWSRDGRLVLFHTYPRGNVFMLPLTPGARPSTVVDSPFTDWVAALSPDGRSLAYVSDETGGSELYVKALDGSSRQRISVSGGVQPRWRGDGGELFFLDRDSRLSVADMRPASSTASVRTTALFDSCGDRRQPTPFMYRYDVTADGSRSLWVCDIDVRTKATVVMHAQVLQR